MHLFGETRGIPAIASSHLQCWALTLSAYNYSIAYKSGKELGNADGFSHLPLPESPSEVPLTGETVLLFKCVQHSPVSTNQIKNWTARDPLLSKVYRYAIVGWPTSVEDNDLLPYFRRRDEISAEGGCLLWGSRIVVPPPARASIVELLHETHPGIIRMKALARSYVWWPGIDATLEAQVRNCHSCQENQRSPPKAPLHPWDWPDRAWARVHVDFAGPFMGKHFLLLVNSYSKWLEIHAVSTTSTEAALSKLCLIFSTDAWPT